ncbi:hypothetical protein KQI65_14575 [bacterium]|nr:hypothetical protein [bacterium]
MVSKTRQTPIPPGTENTRSLRPALLLGALLFMVAAGLFSYSSILTAMRYDVEITPSHLYAVEGEAATLHLLAINRLGGEVPFSTTPCTVELMQGSELVTLEADADSVCWTLRSTGRAGSVSLRVSSEAWPFALFAALQIESPMAQLRRVDRSYP